MDKGLFGWLSFKAVRLGGSGEPPSCGDPPEPPNLTAFQTDARIFASG